MSFKKHNTGVRLSYGLLVILLILELSNLLFKYYTMYYFHVYALGVLSISVLCLGWSLGVNKLWVIFLGIISLSLVTLAYLITWN